MSNLFRLNFKDLLNGLVIAVLGNVIVYLLAIFGELYQLVINGEPFSIIINWKAILVVGVFSALTYLSKRFISNPSGEVFTK